MTVAGYIITFNYTFTLKTMSRVIFATTNKNKVEEAKRILKMQIEGLELPEVLEIQSLNIKSVVENKASQYFAKIQKPLFVEDSALEFSALNGLPGTYINDFCKSIGNAGLLKLLDGYSSRVAKAITAISYVDSTGKISTFIGTITGTISIKESGQNGFGWDPIFIPDGFSKTFAEMDSLEKDKISMRKIALENLRDYLLALQGK